MSADLQAARTANAEAREDLKRALWALKRFRQMRPNWDHVDQETHDELKAAFWTAKARAKDTFIAMAIAAVAVVTPLLLDIQAAREDARRRFEARRLAAFARSWGRLLDRPMRRRTKP